MEIQGLDHLEFYVADAEAAAAELTESFGFVIHGRGARSGGRSVLLRQGQCVLVMTSADGETHPAADYVRCHGAGVAAVGLRVPDAAAAFIAAVERGCPPVAAPHEHGPVTFASVIGFGDVEHRFVSRPAGASFAPGAMDEPAALAHGRGVVEEVDHLAVCLPAGRLRPTVATYERVFGLKEIFTERIVVGQQAMDSIVVQNPAGTLSLTLIEPDPSREPGQIDEFLDRHGGAGVQHVALRTADIAGAVRDGQAHGVGFLSTPAEYYDALPARLNPMDLPLGTLRDLNILADRDRNGVILQIFTASRHARRTFFWELIERRGARTFGSRNIAALYEAVECSRERAGLTSQ